MVEITVYVFVNWGLARYRTTTLDQTDGTNRAKFYPFFGAAALCMTTIYEDEPNNKIKTTEEDSLKNEIKPRNENDPQNKDNFENDDIPKIKMTQKMKTTDIFHG